jgi:tetratricopeptide (TPR) repeat protein
MATKLDSFSVLSIEESFSHGNGAAEAERAYVRLRRELDIGAFGVHVVRANRDKALVGERTAAGPGGDRHEELFVVVDGHAAFVVDGEEIDARAGTAWPYYEAKDFEAALGIVSEALEEYPGNALAHYNIACMSSLLGRRDDAIEHLRAALAGHPPYVENARADDDFASLRDDDEFQALLADAAA